MGECSKEFSDEITCFETEIMVYIKKMAKWEWTVFCKARDAADEVHWARGATLEKIMQATKETGLKPAFVSNWLFKKLQEAKRSMHFVG
jgi:hypothetical protein